MLVHPCKPSTQEEEAGGALRIQSYMLRSCPRKPKKERTGGRYANLPPMETEAGRSPQVQDQPGLNSLVQDPLNYTMRAAPRKQKQKTGTGQDGSAGKGT